MTEATPSNYPIPRPASGDDSRFTAGLTFDVAKVLREHGFPPLSSGGDYVRLQRALFGFIYERPEVRP